MVCRYYYRFYFFSSSSSSSFQPSIYLSIYSLSSHLYQPRLLLLSLSSNLPSSPPIQRVPAVVIIVIPPRVRLMAHTSSQLHPSSSGVLDAQGDIRHAGECARTDPLLRTAGVFLVFLASSVSLFYFSFTITANPHAILRSHLLFLRSTAKGGLH